MSKLLTLQECAGMIVAGVYGDRITPENITELKSNEIFVFGSNLSGRHGKGAAKQALQWGAIYGMKKGLQGQTYAIPTVNADITDKLPLDTIKYFVDTFIRTAKAQTDLTFLVTKIGCGLAGWTVEDIAPLFTECRDLPNVYLPEDFWKIIVAEE